MPVPFATSQLLRVKRQLSGISFSRYCTFPFLSFYLLIVKQKKSNYYLMIYILLQYCKDTDFKLKWYNRLCNAS
jgi:hypothetical protein